MRRHPLALLTVLPLCAAATVHAQAPDSARTPIKPGVWALQFGVGENFTLTSFKGATVSGKYHLSDRNALRVGLTVIADRNRYTSDGTTQAERSSYTTSPAPALSTGSGLEVTHQYALEAQWIRYASPHGRVHIYGGGGLYGSYLRDRVEQTSEVNVSDVVSGTPYHRSLSNNQSKDQWTISGGISGALGVEYTVAQRLTLAGEYGLVGVYMHGAYKDHLSSIGETTFGNTTPDYYKDTRDTQAKINGFRLLPGTVRLILSAYF